MIADSTTTTPFADFDGYLHIPRVTGFVMSPDGQRLVATITSLNDDGNKLASALWSVDPAGEQDAHRLTWSEQGEAGPIFLPNGDLLFTSTRDAEDDDPPALWRLPAAGGEARRVLTLPGGVTAVAVGRESGDVVVSSPRLVGTTDDGSEEKRRKERKEAKTSAILHEASPVRFWDHDLGPDELHLFVLADDDGCCTARDLTPNPGRALDDQSFAVSPDGSFAVASWAVSSEPGETRPQLVHIDLASGERRVLADEKSSLFVGPQISPDGMRVLCCRLLDRGYDAPPQMYLHLVDILSGDRRDVTQVDVGTWTAYFSPDGSTAYYEADQEGHRPLFALDLATGDTRRLTASGHFTNLFVHPDGRTLFALRDHIDAPPVPVRISTDAVEAEATPLRCPGAAVVPGHVEDIATVGSDGTTVRSFLALPDGASAEHPAPLLLWIHGGPISSWNTWSWRWNPWLMVAKGYAVLLPDPAFSTGYGEVMLDRGWGQWGGNPFTDLMAATDAALERDDLDASRTAAMGGSYGGYMANWVAGHTDRFRCLVTHASLWSFEQFQGTTDHPWYWEQEFGAFDVQPERYTEFSPHLFLDQIRTPMLVIHGDKDYRVPVGEGLRLWWDLQRKGVESKYLYYADEGHWILKPGNARVWYETVWAWLARHVLDEPWQRPSLL